MPGTREEPAEKDHPAQRLKRAHYYRITVDLVHDLAAGAFPGAVLALWLTGRIAAATGSTFGVTRPIASSLWLLLVGGMTVLVGTGLLRLRYWKLNVRAGFLTTKSYMAYVKHAGFVLVQLLFAFLLVRIAG